MSSRRKFLLTTGAAASAIFTNTSANTVYGRQLVHHVFFWLKNPDSKEDLNKLLEGIHSLRKINSLRICKVGTPAGTEQRDVVDRSYQVSLLTIFDDVKGHDAYQVDPVHTAFVKNYAHLWSKVVVYDSMDV
jgi:hypothetical protein